MHTFIDESGTFTPNAGISVVGASSLPSRLRRKLTSRLQYITRDWPKVGGELKTARVDLIQLTQITDVLYQHSALLHLIAINMAGETISEVEFHKKMQAEGITKHLTSEHHPDLVEKVWSLRRNLERMPIQLYVQSVAMRELVCETIAESAIYFSQRRPREIGEFNWIIDAKDPLKITTQEEWWHETLGPLAERRSEREPFECVKGPDFNYDLFNRNFRFEKEMWYPDAPRKRIDGLDIRKMLLEHVEFNDSRGDVLIQTTDVLTGYARRLLAGECDISVAQQIGRLQIIRRREGQLQTLKMFSLSSEPAPMKHLLPVLNKMARHGRTMLLKKDGADRIEG
jgi:hypothetical protein